MKGLVIAIIVVLIGLGGYFMYQNQSATQDVQSNQNDSMMNDNVSDDAMMNENDSVIENENDSMMEEDPNAKVFEVGGENFAFDVKEIKVKKGDTVKINFTSVSGFHDWVVDEFDAKTAQVNTGGKTSVTFVADQAGTFEYYCSVGQHRAMGMIGKLIVEE